ncbi:MAG: hypothetical protein Q4B42_05310 [Oscillospiraceae bacterium]|nr:hypothetical protein [Oscillospiraceae bacterium]
MRKRKIERSVLNVQSELRIRALSWKAGELGVSYGKLIGSMKLQEKESVVEQYLQYLNSESGEAVAAGE